MYDPMHDLRRFGRHLEEAARQWQISAAGEAREALERRERKRRIDTLLGNELERCVAALEALRARTLLQCVRDAALPGAFVAGDACITSGPAVEALGKESPVAPDEQQRQAQAASILTWGWPASQGFLAIVVRGPVWWDDQLRQQRYTLGWSTDHLRPPGPNDDKEPELRSWLDFRLDNIIGAEPEPANLARPIFREQLERELVQAMREGVFFGH